MPKISYVKKRFRAASLAIIDSANKIIAEYQQQGLRLTLRQLYYQFVSRDLLANNVKNYNMLGSVVSDGRMAGMIDWEAIEDRTRNLHSLSAWGSPQEIVEAVSEQYRGQVWQAQPWYVEVWIEKEALAGVFEGPCDDLRVPFFCCRGYNSQSEQWGAGMRLRQQMKAGKKKVKILHFGDHDPSGIDMSRDNEDRLAIFTAPYRIEFERVALNMDQVEEYQPPPNPAKQTDSRFADYASAHGDESWELDALDPTVLGGLVREKIEEILDRDKWDESIEEEEKAKKDLATVATRWDDVISEFGE